MQSPKKFTHGLVAVGKRLFPKFITWLVSVMSFCYLDVMLLFNIALADCLREGCCSLPVRQHMQLCRSLQLWYSMNRPPTLPLNDGRGKCEFAAVSCDSVKFPAVDGAAVLNTQIQHVGLP